MSKRSTLHLPRRVPIRTFDEFDDVPQRSAEISLRFTPYAWAKLQYFCHCGDTEIGAFGLSHPEDLLLVTDLLILEQRTTCVTVAFEDDAVADLFDRMVDQGIAPARFARLWLHTHPGNSASPSGTDEETFDRAFGDCDWAIMGILARGGETYARLRFNVGPGGQMLIPVEVDYTREFQASDQDAWQAEYQLNVKPEVFERVRSTPLSVFDRCRQQPDKHELDVDDTDDADDTLELSQTAQDWLDELGTEF